MTKTNLIMPVEPDFLQSMHVVSDRTTSRIAEQEHLPGLPVLWHEVIQVEWLVKDDAGVEQATWQKFRIANLMKKLMNRKLTRETWRVYFHLCRLFRKIQRAEHSDRATRTSGKVCARFYIRIIIRSCFQFFPKVARKSNTFFYGGGM